ncbi:NAD(P)-binding protein [Melanomma pulvis-pyrius CBS 109.77]|uniref:NAD(P)-binding protein n=1 Tax=Melanomma pulvis-pyrius CBS 109.77 TaxID=1314802 RepID=A0A6A6XLH4_9PLEO|nr:NAD(P)-binding protein [Melanomma pulvis-pyrius CBS 109.77]
MPALAIHPGSTVFVTGVNGLIGSHIADQLLARGYHVRGAVRDVEKCAWLTEYFADKHKGAKFELVSVPDMTVEGCYDEAVKGTSGFVHVASPLSGTDPYVAIPTAVNGGLNAVKACAKEPSITRVVFTSSSIASTFPKPNVEFSIDESSYNEVGIKKGWNHPKDEPEYLKGLYMYAALKTETEKALWKWVGEHKPGFVFNSVLPNANFGKVLIPKHQGTPSTIEWAKGAFTGENFDMLSKVITPQWYVDPIDTALIHVSALIYSDVASERLFAFAEPFNFNNILAVYRKLFPGRDFPADVEGMGVDKCKVPNQRALEVLGWVKEGRGWTGLEESLAEMVVDF